MRTTNTMLFYLHSLLPSSAGYSGERSVLSITQLSGQKELPPPLRLLLLLLLPAYRPGGLHSQTGRAGLGWPGHQWAGSWPGGSLRLHLHSGDLQPSPQGETQHPPGPLPGAGGPPRLPPGYDNDTSLSCFIKILPVSGIFLSWDQLALACSAPGFLLITIIFLPESPSFLAQKGREDPAADALCQLKGISKDSAL